jgi:DNA-binding CsgD family transcriptional regulator
MNKDVHSSRHDLDCAVQQVLKLVSVIADDPDLAPARGALDLRLADIALSASERLLTDRRAAYDPPGRGVAGSELAAVLIQVKTVRAALQEAELIRRSCAVKEVQAALRRLRPVRTVDELVERTPVEIIRLGYRRALFSQLRGSEWAARSAFAPEYPGLSDALVRAGSTSPGRLGRELPETELVRRRSPILVHDAQTNPRVHRKLVTLARTKDYIAAPLITRGSVVGLLHADENSESGTVGEFDRDLLGLFAEGLGFAFERTLFYEQLNSLRGRLEDQARSVGDLIDGFVDPGPTAPAAPAAPPEVSSAAMPPAPRARPPYCVDWPLTDLTRRELEVLQHLAEGESNTQIAASLYVSSETVKTHVKNLLRKLGATSRAEAVSRYGHPVRQMSRR